MLYLEKQWCQENNVTNWLGLFTDRFYFLYLQDFAILKNYCYLSYPVKKFITYKYASQTQPCELARKSDVLWLHYRWNKESVEKLIIWITWSYTICKKQNWDLILGLLTSSPESFALEQCSPNTYLGPTVLTSSGEMRNNKYW